jgi:hypothetical protein
VTDALAGPRLFDVVLAATVVEAALLLVIGRRLGLAPRAWLPFLAAGAALALAGRLAAGGGAVAAIGLALVASFIAHVWHLARLRRAGAAPAPHAHR